MLVLGGSDCYICCSVFFYNDSATTEIYTYSHTLSLHDARPIYHRHVPGPAAQAARGAGHPHRQRPPRGRGPRVRRRAHAGRSVEHTSALQSLMRIPYAVFCLKKKILIDRLNTTKRKHQCNHQYATERTDNT